MVSALALLSNNQMVLGERFNFFNEMAGIQHNLLERATLWTDVSDISYLICTKLDLLLHILQVQPPIFAAQCQKERFQDLGV